MGFLFHAIKIPISITSAISIIINLWSSLKFMILRALAFLGLYKPPPEEEDSAHSFNDHIFILDGPCPSLVPIPIHVVTAAIKNRVPIMLYRDFLLKGAVEKQQEEESGEVKCTICMEAIGMRQEVRDLSRCAHVFHRDCLDTWVDSGQVTCPLCRSLLLPPKTSLSGLGNSTTP